jgi:hypothetical protein
MPPKKQARQPPRFIAPDGNRMNSRIFAFAVLGVSMLAPATAQALEGKFRGTYVCEKLPTTRDILRAPFDLVIESGRVQFARPLFNLNGTRVVGSELGRGTLGEDGKLHLTSDWGYLGNTAQGDYGGTLTATGGTLIGTQDWTAPDGATISRTCTAALVPAPRFFTAPRPQ